MTTVTISSGKLGLEGILQGPAVATRAAVVCHPHPLYGGDMNNPVVVAVADALRASGFTVLRFNFRGVGDSDGSYGGGIGEQDDVRAAIAFLRAQTDAKSLTLAGYSFGAMVAMQVAAAAADVGRLVLVAPPLAMTSLDALAASRVPKHFIAGDRDQYCPLADLERAVAALPPPAELHVIRGADHFLFGRDGEIRAAIQALG